MELLYSILVAVLIGTSVYLLMQRSLVRVVLGLTLLSNAANLVIFVAGKFRGINAPFIALDQNQLQAPYADPLPQALILTAIVIGFGVLSFFLVLCLKSYQKLETDDTDEMRATES